MEYFYGLKEFSPFAIIGAVIVAYIFISAFKGKGNGKGGSNNSGGNNSTPTPPAS